MAGIFIEIVFTDMIMPFSVLLCCDVSCVCVCEGIIMKTCPFWNHEDQPVFVGIGQKRPQNVHSLCVHWDHYNPISRYTSDELISEKLLTIRKSEANPIPMSSLIGSWLYAPTPSQISELKRWKWYSMRYQGGIRTRLKLKVLTAKNILIDINQWMKVFHGDKHTDINIGLHWAAHVCDANLRHASLSDKQRNVKPAKISIKWSRGITALLKRQTKLPFHMTKCRR